MHHAFRSPRQQQKNTPVQYATKLQPVSILLFSPAGFVPSCRSALIHGYLSHESVDCFYQPRLLFLLYSTFLRCMHCPSLLLHRQHCDDILLLKQIIFDPCSLTYLFTATAVATMRMLVTTASRRCLPAVGRWTITGKPTAASDLACRSSSILYDSLLQIGSSSSYNDHYFSSSSPRLIGVRSFSTTPPGKEEDDDSSENIISRSLRKVVTPRNQFYALVAGGAIGTYAISRVFLGVTSFFTHLNPSVVAKWGFYTGFGCATMVGGLALVTAENMYIRADPVYRYCLNWVQNDTVVQKSLGDGIKAGGLRSYRLDAGKIEMVGTKPVWRPPRIQVSRDGTVLY